VLIPNTCPNTIFYAYLNSLGYSLDLQGWPFREGMFFQTFEEWFGNYATNMSKMWNTNMHTYGGCRINVIVVSYMRRIQNWYQYWTNTGKPIIGTPKIYTTTGLGPGKIRKLLVWTIWWCISLGSQYNIWLFCPGWPLIQIGANTNPTWSVPSPSNMRYKANNKKKRDQHQKTIGDHIIWDCRDHSEWAFLWDWVLYLQLYFNE